MCSLRQDSQGLPVPCLTSCQPETRGIFRPVLSTISVMGPADRGLSSKTERPISRRDKVEKSGTGNSTPINPSSDRTNPWVCRKGS